MSELIFNDLYQLSRHDKNVIQISIIVLNFSSENTLSKHVVEDKALP